MPLLPDTNNDLLFSCLNPHDIIRYSRTCREAYRQVEGYWRRALNIENLLSPYFTPAETQCFRVVQALTGTLISGSTALQLLSRKRYPESDLDLYVERRYGSFLGSFLEAIGYKFEPAQGQSVCLEEAIERAEFLRNLPPYTSYSSPYTSYSSPYTSPYDNDGFAGVFNMTRGDRTIQLIATTHSPLDKIFKFHSTVVMNVISYSHVYSLYPRATFQESLSLITYEKDDSKRVVARQKYVDRGWKMLNSDGSEWRPYNFTGTSYSYSSKSTPYCRQLEIFQVDRLRRLGDSFCWSSKLPILRYPTQNDCSDEPGYIWLMSRRYDVPTPLVMEELWTGKQALESNTWVLSLQDGGHRIHQVMYDVLDDSELRSLRRLQQPVGPEIPGVGFFVPIRPPGRFAPLDFRVKSRDLLLYDVIDEYFSYLNKGDLGEEPPDTESEGVIVVGSVKGYSTSEFVLTMFTLAILIFVFNV
ncbi:hypothetical protein E1B28_012768 [Marasmius oreades]|uniref:Uncharacterized protein n=1 Tax=Marasmius oreades TaxID=181124 RepID=A0A9P7RSX4_9AGAR|nr:uncharacterized protein E1B28_012768 [Marasmius oreades]KAG7088808.1 hypothetical protein E1B28_012768 [Marasmius oreades]